MTRDGEALEAAKRFENSLYNSDVASLTRSDMGFAYMSGIKWADEHPKSPWISVDEDLPCNHSDLVLTYNDIPFSTERVLVMTDIHTLFLCDMKKDNNRGWIWNYSTKDKITHWMPIPELPKE